MGDMGMPYFCPNADKLGVGWPVVTFASLSIELLFGAPETGLLSPLLELVYVSLVTSFWFTFLLVCRLGSYEVLARRGSPAYESFSMTTSRSAPSILFNIASWASSTYSFKGDGEGDLYFLFMNLSTKSILLKPSGELIVSSSSLFVFLILLICL